MLHNSLMEDNSCIRKYSKNS